ncbi:hypothetical protein K469DRAFT_723543 [Zopfia rhizophila CBS 207.26]|uniref:G-patch domain-containing protein n=1 Tax=Zopfia rhizophila CBS 207.26 TaxID=1314779 RepID=A0A6A6EEX6_9PEZI|nr:hypothetical protein K469DRAFT_723543 [Zopfia rhizophila CBS 207.26]
MPDSDDDAYTIPFIDQRVFGAGLKRKRVAFVPASSTSATTVALEQEGLSFAERYLAIVYPNSTTISTSSTLAPEPEIAKPVCDICNCPTGNTTTVPHEASLAHQVCLEHIYPPSGIDRTRKGLAYLEKQGWDVDARKGLGAKGDGLLFPLKPKEKRDTAGLGVQLKKDAVVKKNEAQLDAGKIRKKEVEDKKKAKKLHDLFYRDDKVSKYLGELG